MVGSRASSAEHTRVQIFAGVQYSLVYIVDGGRVIGFDNERGKGDHRHVKGIESPYTFVSLQRLLADFTAEVEKMRNEPSESEREH